MFIFNQESEPEPVDPEILGRENDSAITNEPVLEEKTDGGEVEVEKVGFGALGLAIMVVGSEIKVDTEESDKTGRPLRETVRTEEGVILATKEHQYNEKGDITETVFKNAKGEIIGRGKYVQKYGGRTEMECYSPSGERLGAIGDLCLECIENPVAVKQERGANGQLSKESMVDKEGRVFCTKEHFYDENGQLIRTDWKNSTGESLGTIEHHHTQFEDGKLETILYKDAQGNKLSSQERHYDNSGNLRRIVNKDDKDQISAMGCIDYTYDENGREVRKVYTDEQGEIWMTVDYERDENGNIIHSVSRDETGKIINEMRRG